MIFLDSVYNNFIKLPLLIYLLKLNFIINFVENLIMIELMWTNESKYWSISLYRSESVNTSENTTSSSESVVKEYSISLSTVFFTYLRYIV